MPGAFSSPFGLFIGPNTTPEEIKKRQQAALGGFADFGGATSTIATEMGYPDVASELKRLQEQDTLGSMIGAFANPLGFITGPIADIGSGIKEWMTSPSPEPPKAMSQDEFIKTRVRAIPTLADYEEQALANVRESDAYKQLLAERRTTAARGLLTEASKRAKANYPADVARIEGENRLLPDAYKTYTAGVNDELESYYGQDFADRHPGLSKAMMAAGPIVAGVLTKGAFGKVNKTMKTLGDDAKNAAKTNDFRKEAEALDKLQWWRDKGKYTGLTREAKTKATGFGLGAAVPLEAQLFADYQDKGLSREYQDADGNWQRARAQQAAEDKLSKPFEYAAKTAPLAVFSGLLGASAGAKFGGKSMADEATALLNPADPSRYADMARRRIAAAEANRAVAAARKAPPPKPLSGPTGPGPGPVGGPATPPPGPGPGPIKRPRAPALKQKDLLSDFERGLANLEKGKPFAPSRAFMRGKSPAAKARVLKGANVLGLTGANVTPSAVAQARQLLSSGNLKLGLAAGATGYSAMLAEKLAEIEAQKLEQ